MKAVIMAGGEGTRLRAVTGARPKPLVPLLGRPLMEHILLLLRQHGFTEVCAALRGWLADRYGKEVAQEVSILYGGSMNAKNAAELLKKPDIDGGLIGGASLIPEEFASIVKTANEVQGGAK